MLSSSSTPLRELLGDFEDSELHQRGAADRLLHAELAAFHAAGKIDFAFAGQQRNRAHFAQIHAYRVVGVNRFFLLLGRMKKIGFARASGSKNLVASSSKLIPSGLRLKIDRQNYP